MKNIKQIAFLIFLLSVFLLSCSKQKPTTLLYPDRDFFNYDSIYPYKYIQIEKFKTFQDLINEVEKTVCNDSTVVIEFKVADTIKKTRLINFCFRNTHVDYRLRNVIEILDDTIRKGSDLYPIDSLFEIMKTDFNNNGANKKFADNPKKVVIFIAYPKLGIESMTKTLNSITTNIDKLGMNDYLHLEISELEKIEIVELPPPPEIDDIELIDETNKEITKEKIGLKFINEYVYFIENKEPKTSLDEWMTNNPYASKKLKLKIKNLIDQVDRDSKLGLDYDPILNAQDYPEKGFEILKTENEYIEVKGIDWPDFIIKLKMIKENEIWKVDNTELKNE